MNTDVKIPFGYKRLPTGEQTRYRDAEWRDDAFGYIRKTKAGWPIVSDREVIIRRCEIKRVEMPFGP